MSIKVMDKPEKPLFHAITKHWQGDGYVLQFLPQYEVEACKCITNLLPYLQHGKNMAEIRELNKHFTAAAVTCSKLCHWDEEQCMVISMQDHMLEGCNDEVDSDYDIINPKVKIMGLQELLDATSKPSTKAVGSSSSQDQAGKTGKEAGTG
jgi:hypothetical protein